MREATNKPKRLLLVLHEIYGINKHITDVCRCFSNDHVEGICPNVLGRKIPFAYDEEKEMSGVF